MILYQMIELLATLIECLIGLLLVSGLVTNQKVEWKRLCITAVAISLVVLGCNQIKLLSFAGVMAGVIGIAVGAKLLCNVKFWDCFIFSVAYVLLILIVDFFNMSIWGSALKNDQFGVYVAGDYSVWRVWHIISAKATMIVLYFFVFRKFVIKIQLWKRKLWIGVTALSLIVFYLGRLTIRESNEQQLLIWSFLILILLFGWYCGTVYLQYEASRRELQFAEERNQMLADNYAHMIHQYRNMQIRNHDIRNHYLVLQELVKTGAYDRAERYIDELEAEKKDAPARVRTGIPVLDILLEYKQNEAMRENIHFEVISDQIQLELTEQEVTALFGNAVDNAMEACRRMKTGARWIRIVIRNVNEMTFIKVSNSFEDMPEMKDKKLLSSKSGGKEYGWGMTSMQVIVDRYGGTMEADFENHQFTLVIGFYC